MADDEAMAEYRAERRVALLRQRLYMPAGGAGPPGDERVELGQALAEAEAELQRLAEARRARERAAGAGLIVPGGAAARDAAAGQGRGGDADDRPAGVIMGPDTTGIDAQVLLRMDRVPSGIIHLLDARRHPLVTFRLRFEGRGFARLRLISQVEGYSAQCVHTVELRGGQSTAVDQLPSFFPAALQQVNELTRATLHVRIDDLDRKTEREQTDLIWLLPRSSAYAGVEDPGTGAWVDFTGYFAAWVTPNAPAVMELLYQAACLHPERLMAGYQVAAEGVREQVRAIFNALKAQGIVYVNSVLAFGSSQGETMQRIRLPRESLLTRSANCIDGTVLMASVLEASSLNPAIVLVPGHALLAWETQDRSGQWDYVETTLIGSADFEVAQADGQKTAEYWQAQARKTGNPSYFKLLALPALRAEQGITPME